MIPFILAIYTSHLVGESSSEGQWVTAALQKAPRIARRNANSNLSPGFAGPSAKLAPQSPGQVDGSPHVVTDPAFVEAWGVVNQVYRRFGTLILGARVQEAYEYTSHFRSTRPDLFEVLGDAYIDSALLAGYYDVAYEDAVEMLQDPNKQNDHRYLRLSLACAARGEVYPGQAEFCQKELVASMGLRRPVKQRSLKELASRTPRQVMLLSALALGGRRDIPGHQYLELALRIDPACEIAAQDLMDFYESSGRYSDMRRVGLSIAKQLPNGPSREKFLKEAARVAKLKDKGSAHP